MGIYDRDWWRQRNTSAPQNEQTQVPTQRQFRYVPDQPEGKRHWITRLLSLALWIAIWYSVLQLLKRFVL